MADRAEVTISLTANEALVLFDLLHRWEDDDRVHKPQHPSEQVALWNLSAVLERELRESFDPAYADLLAEARSSGFDFITHSTGTLPFAVVERFVREARTRLPPSGES